METSRPVIVKRVPENLNLKQARAFLEEVRPLLEHDRPQIVFDLSLVRRIDAAGVDMLLHCMKEASRRDGDLKLASLSPQAQVVLDLTRASRLFEIFASSAEAAHSFSGYLPNMVRQFRSTPAAAENGERKAA
jgi:anti-sigma B factor antagonist